MTRNEMLAVLAAMKATGGKTIRPAGYAPLLTKRRAWFGTEGGDNSGDSGDPGDDGGDPDDDGGDDDGGDRGDHRDDPKKPSRLARARNSARLELLRELGFDSFTAAQAALAGAKPSKPSNTDGDGKPPAGFVSADQLEQERKARETAENSLKEFQQKQALDARNAVILSAATTGRAIDAADVVEWAEKHGGDLLKALEGDKLKADSPEMKALIDACRKARPHYFRGGVGIPTNSATKSTPMGVSPEELDQKLGDRPLWRM